MPLAEVDSDSSTWCLLSLTEEQAYNGMHEAERGISMAPALSTIYYSKVGKLDTDQVSPTHKKHLTIIRRRRLTLPYLS